MIVKDRFLIGRDGANTSMFIHFYIRIDLRSANTFVINQVVSFHLCPIFSNLFSFFSFSFFSSSFFLFWFACCCIRLMRVRWSARRRSTRVGAKFAWTLKCTSFTTTETRQQKRWPTTNSRPGPRKSSNPSGAKSTSKMQPTPPPPSNATSNEWNRWNEFPALYLLLLVLLLFWNEAFGFLFIWLWKQRKKKTSFFFRRVNRPWSLAFVGSC